MNYITLYENFDQDPNQVLSAEEMLMYIKDNFYHGYDEFVKNLENFPKFTKWAFVGPAADYQPLDAWNWSFNTIAGFAIKLGYTVNGNVDNTKLTGHLERSTNWQHLPDLTYFYCKDEVHFTPPLFLGSLVSGMLQNNSWRPTQANENETKRKVNLRFIEENKMYIADIFKKIFERSGRPNSRCPVYELKGEFIIDNDICESMDKIGFEKWLVDVIENKCFPNYFCPEITFNYRNSNRTREYYPTSKDLINTFYVELNILIYDKLKN